MQSRGARQRLDAPISIYELHLGSWKRRDDGSWCSYREMAPRLDRVRAADRVHARRVAPDHGAPVLRVVGLPDHGLLRADVAVRHTDRLHGVRRRAPRCGHRRHPRLGPVALPERRARARVLRRHASVRARRSPPGLPSGLEDARVQLRPQRGAVVPDEQRMLLARPLPRRRPAGRRRRVDVVPRLLA